MRNLFGAWLLLFSTVATADSSTVYPCSCSLQQPGWLVQDKAVQYPPRTLIFEQGALSNVPVGEMWDKVAASRATYSLDMWNQLGVWQSFGGALTFPTDNTVNMTLTPTQWLSLKANAFNTTQLINKIKALQ